MPCNMQRHHRCRTLAVQVHAANAFTQPMDTSVGESEDDEDEEAEMWIEAAKKRIMSSQASSIYMTDNTDKSLSNISVNSNDRESLDLAN